MTEMRNWDITNPQLKQEKAIRRIRYFLSAIFAAGGITLLFSQIIPLSFSYINGKLPEFLDHIRVKPIPKSHQESLEAKAIYDPGQSYFQNLLKEAGLTSQQGSYSYDLSTGELKKIKIDRDYSEPMYLTVDSIDLDDLKITPNVNSYDEDVYNLSLKSGVAHFRGTPLPGDGGNTFIYGHSSVPTWFEAYKSNPEIAFSRLENMSIGDEVIVKKDENTLKYVVRKIKRVAPDDFSILQPQGDQETITLMTCWPLGIGTKRLIVIGERYE
ncbi:sortase [Candidatus Dojkabacteria bacterium]|nr:sortase [Candidatus Dojkabacteria bacterium]